MNRLLPLVAILVFAACSGKSAPVAEPELAALRGQWVVVNYWAQWCKPCIEEIPELNQLDRERPDVSVLGVNYEGATGEILSTQVRELGVSFPTISDPAAELGIPRPVVLPTTLLINPAGNVVNKLVGPQTMESLENFIAQAAAASGKDVP